MKSAKQILLSLAAALLVTAILATGALNRLDRWTQDALFQHRGVPSGDIVIIGIDNETLDYLGPTGERYRDFMAYALDALAADPDQRPAVVAIDLLYAGNSSEKTDGHLAQAAEKLGCVITATWADTVSINKKQLPVQHYEEPYQALRDVTVQGHIIALADDDGVMRHAFLYVTNDGELIYSMPLQAARLYREANGQAFAYPPDAGKDFYIPYTGCSGDYAHVSLKSLLYNELDPGIWKDKIVLIGPYAEGLSDHHLTSIDRNHHMFGTEIQANVIQCLLEGNYKFDMSHWLQLGVVFAVSCAAMFLFLRFKMLFGGGVCLGLMVLSGATTWLLYLLGWVSHPLWLPAALLALYILALAAHYMVAAKERRTLALEKERIGAELALATRIQASSLPKEFPPFPDRKEFDIYASMSPAKEVGGDLYDFFMIDSDHLGMVIGDVSGKGVPAALFMMVSMALIRHIASREISPAKALTTVNTEICARNPEEMFVTVWLGVLELSTGRLTAANAGHEYPALKAAGGSFELVKDKHGFVIGGMDGVRYRQYEMQLEPGAKLFVYTDGVPEATNSKEELFGTDRMIQVLRSREDGTPEQILEAVNSRVQAFVGEASQFDDLTMLCIQYNGPGTAKINRTE